MSDDSSHPALQQQQQHGSRDYRVLSVSRVVWDHVASPGWLDGPRDSRGNSKPDALERRHADLFRAAEAMFPIVGLVCRRALAFDPRREGIGSYGAIVTAASAPAPSCVAWIINNRHVRGMIGNEIAREIVISGINNNGLCRVDSGVVGTPAGTVDVGVVVKEVSATVIGLLVGGHVGLATSMFGGGIGNGEEGRHDTTTSRWTLPRLWDGRRVVGWETACRSSENENGNGNGGDCTGSDGADAGMGVMVRRLRQKVIEYLRASCGKSQFLHLVCLSGCVDSVRWLVDVLGIGGEEALLVMHRPMQSSLSHGKLEVVKWLFERFRFERELHETAFCDLYNVCALGVSPSNFKWCLENFPVGPRRDSLTCTLVPNKHSTVQDCQLSCVEDYLRENGYPFILEIVCNPDVVKWLLTTFPPHPPPSEDELNHVCMNTGNVELTQWLVTEHHFTPTAATFASACSTSRKKGSTLAKWLSTRVSLSQSDINKSLVCALNWSNIKVAEWLDETFHVMDVVNSNTQVAENFLIDLCKESTDYEDKVVGLEWFLKRLSPSQASKITMTCIHEAVSQALEEPRANSVALLLEMFTAFEPHKDMEQFKNIVTVFLRYHLNGFQSLCTGSGSAVLTPEFVGDCLTSESFYPYSSKVVKWVIRKFNVQYTQIKANNNQLLFRLLTRRKNRCAQWLIESFNIPLSDILAMAKLGDESGASIDLTGWHMILNHYGPTIDAALIRKHLMPLVSRSPHVAIHAISSFGLTKSEIRDYVDVQSRDPNGDTFSAEVNLWHGMPFHSD